MDNIKETLQKLTDTLCQVVNKQTELITTSNSEYAECKKQSREMINQLSGAVLSSERLILEIREEYRENIRRLQDERDGLRTELGRALTSLKQKDNVIIEKDKIISQYTDKLFMIAFGQQGSGNTTNLNVNK